MKNQIASEPVSLLDKLTTAYNIASNITLQSGQIGLIEAMDSPELNVSAQAAFQIHDLVKEFPPLITADERFLGDTVRMIKADSGAMGFYPHFIGIPLLRRALHTRSPQAAIEWLLNLLATSSASGNTIFALWNVPVDDEIQLTHKVKIVPINNLPDSPQKRWLTGGDYFRNHSPLMTPFNFKQPESALIMSRNIEPLLFNPDTQPQQSDQVFLETHELLNEITLALTVVGPRPPISPVQWFTFDDPDINQVSMMSGAKRGQLTEILPLGMPEYPKLDCNDAPDVIQRYLALHGKTRSKVRVALQRLKQAQLRHGVGDRAVELSIAFETLLGDDKTTEMTHKIKVRSVKLIGGPCETRKQNAALITAVYDIRSKLVHTGHDSTKRIKLGSSYISASEAIDRTVTMCANLIRIVINKGAIPEWASFDIIDSD